MEIEFVKISPTQNMTILVTSPVDRQFHKDAAKKIMAYDNVHAEQVGFVEKPENPKAQARLQMAGGEFCGNAAMSLCAYLIWNGDVKCEREEQCTIPIEVSGASDVLYCDIKKKDEYFLAKINMPIPETIGSFDVEIAGCSLPVVYMPGITHVIADTDKVSVSKDMLLETLVFNPGSFTKEDAFGIMFYDKKAGFIEPFVHVATAGTKMWERGCGSGTAALGAYLAHVAGKSVKVDIAQPGGVITVEADIADGKLTSIRVEGKAVIAAHGKAYI